MATSVGVGRGGEPGGVGATGGRIARLGNESPGIIAFEAVLVTQTLSLELVPSVQSRALRHLLLRSPYSGAAVGCIEHVPAEPYVVVVGVVDTSTHENATGRRHRETNWRIHGMGVDERPSRHVVLRDFASSCRQEQVRTSGTIRRGDSVEALLVGAEG